MTGNPTKYRVTKAYRSPYPEPIIFHQGDTVEVGQEFNGDPDWKDWLWCEGTNETKAWVPKQYLDIRAGKGTFKRDYNAMELTVSAGEALVVYETINGFGMAEKSDGMRGWVPLKHIELDQL